MDTKIHFEYGFKLDGVFFGWHGGSLYQLPYTQNGAYYGLRLIKPKATKGGWIYYRVRRKKMGLQKIRAMLQSVSWDVNKPVVLTK